MGINITFPSPLYVLKYVDQALCEDIGSGDITTEGLISEESHSTARIIARESLVLAGVPLLPIIFRKLDELAAVTICVRDGQHVSKNQVIARVSAKTRAVLSVERVVLNFLQRLSGIATTTRRFVDVIGHSNVILTDTRKTTPGLRLLEKYAVRCGGGRNHRFCLSDGILIKDNHLACFKSLGECVNALRDKIHFLSKIEVEVNSLDQLRAAIESGVDVVMLDNMSLEEIKQAVKIAQDKVLLEVSGNIDLERVRKIAATGIHIISSGYITHSAPWVDISLEIV